MRSSKCNIVFFIIAISAIILALKVLNLIPPALQGGVLQKYGSVEEVRQKLKIREIYEPAYYPQCFRWPPVLIAAQTSPYTAVLMEFARSDGNDVCLVITQTAGAHPPLAVKVKLAEIRESVTYDLRGRQALLEVGVCIDGTPCSRISWQERGYHIRVALRRGPVDLVKIAEGMSHGGGK